MFSARKNMFSARLENFFPDFFSPARLFFFKLLGPQLEVLVARGDAAVEQSCLRLSSRCRDNKHVM